jgi:hypothetical protein
LENENLPQRNPCLRQASQGMGEDEKKADDPTIGSAFSLSSYIQFSHNIQSSPTLLPLKVR